MAQGNYETMSADDLRRETEHNTIHRPVIAAINDAAALGVDHDILKTLWERHKEEARKRGFFNF